MFAKYAFVPILRPFKLEELLRSLALQLDARKGAKDFVGDTQKDIASMGVVDLTEVLVKHLQGQSCLIVLDDLSSTTEWDKILHGLVATNNPSLLIVITTRREDVAKHCCKKPMCIRLLNGLKEKDAFNLFTKKVFKNKTTDLTKHYPELVEPSKLILKKCNGLPLAIVTIGGFLADQPKKTVTEWRKLNEHIGVELEMNPKFEAMKMVLMKSYDGLPYYLKSYFLYLSIFLEDRNVSRRHLVYRWIAEGYARDKSIADRYFMELVERSMILPTQQSVCSMQGIDSCQLHDLIRDISIAKSTEENLVFRLEEGCSSNTHGAVRHLAISSNWEGDEHEFESTVELSRIRSLTVFGKYMPFYVSDKMRFLRVLDLEETEDLADHHLEHVGKLLHLRYLSLRGCYKISYLPDSVGNMRQLETLDIRYTRILVLPKTITKLSKLRYLHAGDGIGVKVPRGIRKLKIIHTLRYVYIASGKAFAREIKALTSLRKLGVFGINTKNGPELCSAISCSLGRLESLSLESDGTDLNACLHAMSPPPENLQSLKLRSWLKKLPEWIKGLQNLVKLKLDCTKLSGDSETMQVLGNLPNLSILFLKEGELQMKELITFKSGLFRSLVVLEVILVDVQTKSLEFEPTTLPKLEVLKLHLCKCNARFSGLELLSSIKEVRLSLHISSYDIERKESMTFEEAEKEAKRMEDKVKDDIVKQLGSNKNRPIVKMRRHD
ncbi:hypothetical protein ACQJBY_030875 [Aegilops geniculata]